MHFTDKFSIRQINVVDVCIARNTQIGQDLFSFVHRFYESTQTLEIEMFVFVISKIQLRFAFIIFQVDEQTEQSYI